LGQSISVENLAHRIIELVGRPVTLKANNSEQVRPANVEADRLEADNRLAAQVISWQPEVSLESGLQRTIDWIREHLDQFNPDTYLI
jgi:dTDP-glucose 4,6-dehydratase